MPLGAEANEKYLKVILLDCGLCCASLGLSLYQLSSLSEIAMINSGGMAEQLTGQLLRSVVPPCMPPSLHYWQREKKNSAAEVDYVIQHENQIIPVEVKAGTAGSLRSLREFVIEKSTPLAVRVNSDKPSLCKIQLANPTGAPNRIPAPIASLLPFRSNPSADHQLLSC